MPDGGYLVAVVLVCAAVTWGLRLLPFAVLAPLRGSATVHYLNERMPVGVMVILAVYSLRDVSGPAVPPTGIALVVTLALHLWRRNAVLSILAGTAVHVLLVGVAGG